MTRVFAAICAIALVTCIALAPTRRALVDWLQADEPWIEQAGCGLEGGAWDAPTERCILDAELAAR